MKGCEAAYNYKAHLKIPEPYRRAYKCYRMKAATGTGEGGEHQESCGAAFRVHTYLANHVKKVHEENVARLHCGEGFPIRSISSGDRKSVV